MAFLLANWRWVLMAAVVAGAAIYVGILKAEVSHYRSAARDCAVRAEGLEAKLQAQNDAIQALAEESKKKTAAAAQALSRARKDGAAARGEADRLRGLANAPRASTSNPACPAGAAVADIRKGLKGLK